MDFDQTWYILSPRESGTLLIFKVKGDVTEGSVTISLRYFVGEGIITETIYTPSKIVVFDLF
jgi:hypothetical protein